MSDAPNPAVRFLRFDCCDYDSCGGIYDCSGMYPTFDAAAVEGNRGDYAQIHDGWTGKTWAREGCESEWVLKD